MGDPLKALKLGFVLGWQDIRQIYRRSSLGQLWITLGMAITIASVGVVFGQILNLPARDYLPFLASGIVLWNFLSNTIIDGSNAFIYAESLIKQLPVPKVAFIFRAVAKNLFTLAHNILLVPLTIVLFGAPINFAMLVFPIGLLIATLTVACVITPIAIFSARFRDLPPIVSSVMGVAFYITPVLWKPESLSSESAHLLLGLNPIYHLLQIMRLPLLGKLPTVENWGLSLMALAIGLVTATFIFKKFSKQIAYWV